MRPFLLNAGLNQSHYWGLCTVQKKDENPNRWNKEIKRAVKADWGDVYSHKITTMVFTYAIHTHTQTEGCVQTRLTLVYHQRKNNNNKKINYQCEEPNLETCTLGPVLGNEPSWQWRRVTAPFSSPLRQHSIVGCLSCLLSCSTQTLGVKALSHVRLAKVDMLEMIVVHAQYVSASEWDLRNRRVSFKVTPWQVSSQTDVKDRQAWVSSDRLNFDLFAFVLSYHSCWHRFICLYKTAKCIFEKT